jgi:hypothetical protein
MVVLAENGVARNGEPETLDLYRSPSSTIADLVIGLLMGMFSFSLNNVESNVSETPTQVADDRARIGHPLHLTTLVGDFEARYLGQTGTLQQCRTVHFVMLGILARNRERQAMHLLPDLETKRAGFELIQSEVLALLIHCRLLGWQALECRRATDHFPKQHHRAEDDAQCFEK